IMRRLGAVAVALLVLVAAGCGGSSLPPGEAVKTALLKANEGKYTEANECLTAEAQGQYAGDTKKDLWDVLTKKGTIKSVEVAKEDTKGEGANVALRIVYNDGATAAPTESVVKEKGRWRTSFAALKTDLSFSKASDVFQSVGGK